jgi:hypothetical protein
LYRHFVDLYGAFKRGIRNFSFLDKEKSVPRVIRKGLLPVISMWRHSTILMSDKKYQSKKWWIQDVAEMLLPLHLAYMNEFSGGQQTAGWLSEKAMVHRIKFKTDQKNWLDELAKKRKAEEEEQLDPAVFHSTCSGLECGCNGGRKDGKDENRDHAGDWG